MNNPNPFIPQGSLLEQRNKKRKQMKLAVLAFFACNILLVGPLLLNGGCRRGDQASDDTNATKTAADAAMEASNNAVAAIALAAASNTPPVANPVAVAVPPLPTATPPPAASATEYTIVAHDTLAGIAAKNHVTLKALEAANPTKVPTKLKVGDKLTIPEAAATTASATTAVEGDGLYLIKPGDNLSKIATKYGTTVAAIRDLNGLKSNQIKAGDKLKVPAAKAATAASPMESMPATTAAASNPQSGAPIMR